MRLILKRNITIAALSIATIGMSACTKLDENLYSSLRKETFYKNKLEVLQAASRSFTHMQAWLAPTGQNGHYFHSESAADQLAWPQKGRHGYDGGDHFRLHYHTWTDNEGRLRDAWRLIWEGLGYVNNAIADIETLNAEAIGMTVEELNEVLAQLRVLRGFHYLKIMDLWGNVPISTAVATEPLNPETKPRAEVFAFIEKEIRENVELLPLLKIDSEQGGASNGGHVSRAAGYAMLAELYLNAEKWAGKPMWDECINYCDKIIAGEGGGNGGTPKLASDINELFANDNSANPESLFQFQYSRKAGFTFDWGGFFMGYDNIRDVLNVGYGGWNAFVVIPTAFDAFSENDLRKKEWFLFGPQYKYGTSEQVLGTEEWDGKPFAYVNSIRRESEGDLTSEGSMAEGEENSGARFNKYKSGTLSDANYQENDFIIYRLTEIYFNKAEALIRKNGGITTDEAVELINDSRKRAFTAEDWPSAKFNSSTLDLEALLAERGREFIFEGKRRTDLIRFGKFTTATWWDHKPSNDVNKELFAIPQTQRAINPNLDQNPGYLN
ncbi:RagB/SusD family nutrient uptake outer membrane protein [Sphingobacterium pedocola]|uniref:RagB/SusD family nutrient uptake outer membrane protein n=1 Tax=Sphingobacterium pedocola TaxID=2082722 RepID=A0ABR9T338_9SPHI|nr:RagB/SusD family nutrient uptake outer membrane protein [Sphingobacterium pedocola]MBE8719761.1 RagB/SusD family nutrient uptake outer membrane protein [Sphingobacterium pedocola]